MKELLFGIILSAVLLGTALSICVVVLSLPQPGLSSFEFSILGGRVLYIDYFGLGIFFIVFALILAVTAKKCKF